MRSRLPYLLLASTFLVGCVADPEPSVVPLSATSELATYGVVELTATSDRGERAERLTMRAHFMAYAGVERDSLLRGLDVWEPPATPGCELVDAPLSATAGTVHLLDAGEVGYGDVLSMQPRSVPSYHPRFHGVLYSTDTPIDTRDVVDTLGTVWVEGGTDVPPFATDLDAPPPVRVARINGAPTGSRSTMSIDWAGGLAVELETASQEAYVEIHNASPIPGPSIMCWVDADGPLHIGASELEGIFGAESHLMITARTAHHTSLPDPAGIEGSVIFDYEDRIEVVRR